VWGNNLWPELIGILGWQDIPLRNWNYVALTILLFIVPLQKLNVEGAVRARVAIITGLAALGYVVLVYLRAVSVRQKNLELHIFPGVQHGYMMCGMPNAFDHQAREFSMGRAVAILAGFRSGNVQKPLRQAS
jgi:sulfite exporter TauE/SafE